MNIFLLGFCKKVILADGISTYANPVFTMAKQGVPMTFFEAWCGVLAYSLQLYFDFSGYSDMAIGAARMFGIKLPLNFDSPYKSKDIVDFWRRWHITLSRLLRDYLYIPLGGNQKGEIRRNINLMITMLLGGLWHGANWTFIWWGGLHGIYLIINQQWLSLQKKLGKDPKNQTGFTLLPGRIIMFIAVLVGWVFFRAENIGTATNLLAGMCGLNGISLPRITSNILANWGFQFKGLLPNLGKLDQVSAYMAIFLLLLIAWFTPNTQEWMANYEPALEESKRKSKVPSNKPIFGQKWQWQPTPIFGIAIGILLFMASRSFLYASSSEFLYFNF